jgi:hypothetical protein
VGFSGCGVQWMWGSVDVRCSEVGGNDDGAGDDDCQWTNLHQPQRQCHMKVPEGGGKESRRKLQMGG